MINTSFVSTPKNTPILNYHKIIMINTGPVSTPKNTPILNYHENIMINTGPVSTVKDTANLELSWNNHDGSVNTPRHTKSGTIMNTVIASHGGVQLELLKYFDKYVSF